MDDILVYRETVEKHVALVRYVRERLWQAHLVVGIKKSSFYQYEVKFLGDKISDKEESLQQAERLKRSGLGQGPRKLLMCKA